MDILTRVLNKVAGTIVDGVPTLTATVAANRLAGTSGLSLVGALNQLVGTSGRDLAYVVNQLGGSSGLDVNGAALYYESLPSRLLPTATFWIDAVDSGGSQRPVNLGSGGSTLNPQLGSVTSGLIIDPANGFIELPNSNNNFIEIAHSSALNISGDIEIIARVSLTSWNTGSTQAIASKANAGTAWRMFVTSTGTLEFGWWNGATLNTRTSTVATGFSAGATKWIRVTLDVNNGASGHDVAFYTGDDGSTWTQLGTTVTTAGTTAVNTVSDNVFWGRASGVNVSGKMYRLIVNNGIGGTAALDVNCSAAFVDRPQFVASTGQIATINNTSRDSNDPVWLEHTGTNYVYLPGVNSNYLSVLDSAALDITGDLDLRVWCALDDWTPSAIQILIGKRETNQIAYQMGIDTTGNVRLLWSTDGVTGILATSTVATGVADGSAKWIRATLDVNNGASGYSVQFFTSDNGTSWTQLGTTVTVAGVTSVFASTANLNIGARNSGAAEPAAGKFYRAQVRNGIDGTLVCDVDTSVITSGSATSFTEKSSNAATVTINRGSSGRKSVAVTRTVWLLGTDDYLQVADNALLDFNATQSFTVLAMTRIFGTLVVNTRVVDKMDSNALNGWGLFLTATARAQATMNGTSYLATPTSAIFTLGAMNVLGMRRDASVPDLRPLRNFSLGGASTVARPDVSNSQTVRIGIDSGGSNALAAELAGVAIFRRALTIAEIAAIAAYYRDRYL